MSRRQADTSDAAAPEESYTEPEPAPAPEPAAPDKYAELEKIAELHKQGVLSDEEFEAEKKKILG